MPNNVAIILKPLVARPTPHHDQHYTSADIRNGRWNFADRQERHIHTRTNIPNGFSCPDIHTKKDTAMGAMLNILTEIIILISRTCRLPRVNRNGKMDKLCGHFIYISHTTHFPAARWVSPSFITTPLLHWLFYGVLFYNSIKVHTPSANAARFTERAYCAVAFGGKIIRRKINSRIAEGEK